MLHLKRYAVSFEVFYSSRTTLVDDISNFFHCFSPLTAGKACLRIPGWFRQLKTSKTCNSIKSISNSRKRRKNWKVMAVTATTTLPESIRFGRLPAGTQKAPENKIRFCPVATAATVVRVPRLETDFASHTTSTCPVN